MFLSMDYVTTVTFLYPRMHHFHVSINGLCYDSYMLISKDAPFPCFYQWIMLRQLHSCIQGCTISMFLSMDYVTTVTCLYPRMHHFHVSINGLCNDSYMLVSNGAPFPCFYQWITLRQLHACIQGCTISMFLSMDYVTTVTCLYPRMHHFHVSINGLCYDSYMLVSNGAPFPCFYQWIKRSIVSTGHFDRIEMYFD